VSTYVFCVLSSKLVHLCPLFHMRFSLKHIHLCPLFHTRFEFKTYTFVSTISYAFLAQHIQICVHYFIRLLSSKFLHLCPLFHMRFEFKTYTFVSTISYAFVAQNIYICVHYFICIWVQNLYICVHYFICVLSSKLTHLCPLFHTPFVFKTYTFVSTISHVFSTLILGVSKVRAVLSPQI